MSDARRHVLISGGTRGLGKAFVETLLEAGYAVSTFGRSPSPFVEESALRHPDRFAFFTGDASSATDVDAIVRGATQRFGAPYAVVNNAGIAADGVLATFDPDRIDQVLAINLAGTLLLTRRALRGMLLSRGGRIVNISSIIGQRGYSGLAVYAATKAGIDGITRALARELGDRGITVNSIAPGYLETEMTHGLSEEQKRQIVRRTPLGALGTPKDVTGLLLFLLSDAAGFITGQTITVDGGVTC
jgi:3-oxoacyl-[acyl-carrier protein] reductase